MTEPITGFRGAYAFLSNFYPAKVTMDGAEYLTLEHAYQAAKFTSPVRRMTIRAMTIAAQARNYGRSNPIETPDWDNKRVTVMLKLLRCKFMDPGLRTKLIATGDALLVESNWWHDNFFGSCTCPKCGNKGKNMLGILLMTVRHECKSAS